MTFGGELGRLIREREVFCFEPDFISDLIGVRWRGSCCFVQGFLRLLPFLRCLSGPIIDELDCGWWIREFYCDLRGISQECFYWGDACRGVGVVIVYCRGYR